MPLIEPDVDLRVLDDAIRRTVRRPHRIRNLIGALALVAVAVFGIFAVTNGKPEGAATCGYPVRVLSQSGSYLLVNDYPYGTCGRWIYTNCSYIPWYTILWSYPNCGGGGGGSW